MTGKQKISADKILLLVILLVAAVLRFWNYSEIPYMHDELSALARTQYPDFRNEITYGVAIYDTHPAGVQLFIFYWIKIFGTSEMSVKFPFILFGLLSIVVAYNISKKWFNNSVGLIVAAFMAVLQYMVMYSQIARPYISGMFFCLLMVWCWSNYLFGENKSKNKWLVGYIISSALAAYNHHFALLFTVVVGLTGMFFLDKNNWKGYIIGGVAIFLLYIPHLNILFYQLSKGGLGGPDGWLAKPDVGWLLSYIKYLLHYSYWMYTLLIVIIGLSIFFCSAELKEKQKFRIIAISWFLTIFLIEYCYSVKVNPIIQFSTLIFVFPFLLIFIFSLFGELNNKIKTFLVLSILITGPSTLAFQRKHFQIFYKQPYQEEVKNTYKNLDIIKDEKKATIVLMLPIYYKEYYFKKYNRRFDCVYYNPFDEKPDTKKFRKFVQEQTTAFFIIGNLPAEYIEIIKEKYPYTIDKQEGFTYSTACFTSKKPESGNINSALFSKTFDLSAGGNKIDSSVEYGPAQVLKVSDLKYNSHSTLVISAKMFSRDPSSNPTLVADLVDGDKSVAWNGAEYLRYNNDPKGPNNVFLCRDISTLELKKHLNAQLKIYIWNRDKNDVSLEDLKVEIFDGNNQIYGLYEPVEKK